MGIHVVTVGILKVGRPLGGILGLTSDIPKLGTLNV
jgi:hypothetical protein